MARHLTEDERISMRRMRVKNPNLTYGAIAKIFNTTAVSVFNAVTGKTYKKPKYENYQKKPVAEPVKRRIGPNPQPAGSCISPIPLSRLMSGRA